MQNDFAFVDQFPLVDVWQRCPVSSYPDLPPNPMPVRTAAGGPCTLLPPPVAACCRGRAAGSGCAMPPALGRHGLGRHCLAELGPAALAPLGEAQTMPRPPRALVGRCRLLFPITKPRLMCTQVSTGLRLGPGTSASQPQLGPAPPGAVGGKGGAAPARRCQCAAHRAAALHRQAGRQGVAAGLSRTGA